MKYPIMITFDDLQNNGIALQTGENADRKNEMFLNDVHRTLYEFLLLVSMRSIRLRVIEKHKERLEPQIKEILVNIARSLDLSGDYQLILTGRTTKNDGSTETLGLQDVIASAISPDTWQTVFSLEPNVMWAGGEV